jgi:glycosyltransferase involved in cell wall biosynthesis
MDYSMQDAASSPLRRLYIRVMDAWIRRYGTVGLACGAAAAKALYGARYGRDPRVSVLHCGLDLGAFDGTGDVHAVRAELAIPDDAPVVGHVGRFDGQKNHAFLIDVAERVCKAMPDVRFLLVGDGPLRAGIEADVARRGLSSNFIFAGNRRDVPRLMLGAMDSFVLPSRYEGLPLVLVEAQAAGLPCIASTAVTSEADLVPGLVQHLDLALPLERWADEVVKSVSSAPPVSRAAALDIVKQTDFSIDQCVSRLLEVYGV